ncbi:Os06g0591550 [Oryza sativa Japonica Group]|uniref:Os06g0591550 protein n=1 Tax=Oryza sativa subsp. japonica TaxID=39947 RepID=C7J3W7_ORYSJ|nr:Os06g0591550 [Oryza sativa Japonica Group]|eukprot:NP_001174880.1 Os06g0591550 [Oryza sativa Japonica Group]
MEEAVSFVENASNFPGYRWEAWSCPASWDDTES